MPDNESSAVEADSGRTLGDVCRRLAAALPSRLLHVKLTRILDVASRAQRSLKSLKSLKSLN